MRHAVAVAIVLSLCAAAPALASGSTLGRRERQRLGRSTRRQDRKAIAAVTGAEIRKATHHGAAAPLQ